MPDHVVVVNTEVVASSSNFEHLSSLVEFIAMFVDEHDRWDVRFEMVLVHSSSKVLRFRGRTLQELVSVGYGIQMAGWLGTDNGAPPSMNYMDWLDNESLAKVFDSRYTDEERQAIMQDLGHIPEDDVTGYNEARKEAQDKHR